MNETTDHLIGELKTIEEIRTQKNINDIIKKVKKHWKKHPELRLGQLLYHAIFRDEDVKKKNEGNRVFYIEDDELVSKIDALNNAGAEQQKPKNIGTGIAIMTKGGVIIKQEGGKGKKINKE